MRICTKNEEYLTSLKDEVFASMKSEAAAAVKKNKNKNKIKFWQSK